MEGKRKRNAISLATKMEILHAVDSGEKKSDVAKKYGIPSSTLSTILSNRSKIDSAVLLGTDKKKYRPCQDEALDTKMFDFLMESRSANIPISGPILQEKARYEALRMGIEGFQASNGWLHRFKSRWSLTTLKVSGEEGSVDPAVEEAWTSKLNGITAGYAPNNIFNADEAGVFFNLLPDKTLALKGETCHGGKKSKDRFTVLLCSNSDGTEKLAPLVIGKFARPRCFKNVKNLPCPYKFNKKSWMTSSIFCEWLGSVDARMGCKNRKILMFLDNCSAHRVEGIQLRNVKVVYFPPNTTSKLQPMDQGVISQVKRIFRRQLVQYLIRKMECQDTENMKWNILQAMQRICMAWSSIEATSIAKCFQRAGFQVSPNEIDDETLEHVDEDEWKHVTNNAAGATFEDFVEVDSAVITSSSSTDETQPTCKDNEQDEEGEEIEAEVTRPSRKDVYSALDVLERFLLTSDCSNNQSSLKSLRQVECAVVQEMKISSCKQTSIRDYFSEK